MYIFEKTVFLFIILIKITFSRDLSGQRARRRVADRRGPVIMAGLSLNKIGGRGPTPQTQGVKCSYP